jgi:deoxyadenosine/deoxycytidine kinase
MLSSSTYQHINRSIHTLYYKMSSQSEITLPIVIDGNIGSGKSTLLKRLNTHPWIIANRIQVVEENVNEWAPYLEQFYKDMKQNALMFQMKVLQHHMKQSKSQRSQWSQSSSCGQSLKITERSPLSCLHVFGENLYQNGMLSKLDMQLMNDMNRDFGWMPRTIFFINTSPELCYERIHIRSRENEIIPMSYLVQIDELYQSLYIDKETIHPLRPRECHIIDGSVTPDEVLEQAIAIMRSQYNSYIANSSHSSSASSAHSASSLHRSHSYPTMSYLNESYSSPSMPTSQMDVVYELPHSSPNRQVVSTYRLHSDIHQHGNFGYQ